MEWGFVCGDPYIFYTYVISNFSTTMKDELQIIVILDLRFSELTSVRQFVRPSVRIVRPLVFSVRLHEVRGQ